MRHLILLLALLICVCDYPPEEYEQEPNVYCLLTPQEDTVYALVGLSAGFDDTLKNTSRWNGVSGASVKIGYLSLREIPDSAGHYLSDSLSIMPSDTFHLEIRYPDARIVKGHTVIPDSFAFVSILIDTIIRPENDTVRIVISWSRSNNARGYLVLAEIYYAGPSGIYFWQVQYLSDSTIDSLKLPLKIMAPDTLDLVETNLQIWALDENYYDYCEFRDRGYETDPTPYMHLEGGLGVFGSYFKIKRRVL